jgi:hypothetical protein
MTGRTVVKAGAPRQSRPRLLTIASLVTMVALLAFAQPVPAANEPAPSTSTSEAGEPGETGGDLAAIEAELQGTFQNAWHPVELELATLEAAGLADWSDPGVRDWIESLTTAAMVRAAVKFDEGTIIQYGAADGGALGVGWEGTYRLLDDHTIEAFDNDFHVRTVYEFALHDGILTIDVISDEDPVDLYPQTAIYETLPFTRVP